MVWAPCKNCGKETERHSKDLCITCYKKLLWKPKKRICKRCKKERVMHAKGLCAGCYQFVFRLQNNKAWNRKNRYNISNELYEEITESCSLCGFNKIVELHHIDENRKNNSRENLVGLCPNHHKMLHDFRYREETQAHLREKGYKIPEDIKVNFEKIK